MVVVSVSRPENRRWRCGVLPLLGWARAAEDEGRCGDGVVTEMAAAEGMAFNPEAGMLMLLGLGCGWDADELS